MYKLYIVRIFDLPLSVSSKFTYKIVCFNTISLELKLEIKYIVLLLIYSLWLAYYFATADVLRSISSTYNNNTLNGVLSLRFYFDKECEYKSLSGNFYTLYYTL